MTDDSGFEKAEEWHKMLPRFTQMAKDAYMRKYGREPANDEELTEAVQLLYGGSVQ